MHIALWNRTRKIHRDGESHILFVQLIVKLSSLSKILNSCTERADAASDEVRLRINGAITDLHSAEAIYHENCRKEFMGHRNV